MDIKALLKCIYGLLFFIIFLACQKEKDDQPDFSWDLNDGIFIVNEGPYGNGSGTISFMKRDGSKIQHKVFQEANLFLPLGNIVQSMRIIDGIAFIPVNNANKVVLAMASSFQHLKTIENIDYPAYVIDAGDNKAYISSWDNTIKIFSTENVSNIGQIWVGVGPTRMAKIENTIWVLNQGGLSVDSTVSVIDYNTDEVVRTIMVYPRPTGIQQDKNGLVWILCSGKGYWQNGASKGHLIAIDPSDYSMQKDIIFPDTLNHPEKLIINNTGEVLFYNYPGGVYKYEIESDTLETSPFIEYPGIYYSLGYDPVDDYIYVSDPVDYIQKGWVFRYQAANGLVVDSVKVGITPREYEFVD